MMKFMLFGLLIRGKLVTCQYMLSEIRSIITLVSKAFRDCSLTRKRSSSRSHLARIMIWFEQRLLTLVADAVQALVFHMGPPRALSLATRVLHRCSFHSRLTCRDFLSFFIAILSRKINIQSKHSSASTPH
jgi:hypothetical protein